MSHSIEEIVDQIRLQLSKKCGAYGIRNLSHAFLVNDHRGDGKVDFHTFQSVLNKAGVFVSRPNSSKVYRYLDAVLDERVDFRDFLALLIGEMSQRRANLVEQAFDTLSDGKNSVPVSTLMSRFRADQHPRVVTGEFTPEAAFNEFFGSFPAAASNTGSISLVEFRDYYNDFSAVFPFSDDAFGDFFKRVWGVQEPLHVSAKAVASQRQAVDQVRQLIVDKIQQRSKAGASETDTLRKCFKSFDLDDDGLLSFSEFFNALSTFGIFLSESQQNVFFESVAPAGSVKYVPFTHSLFEQPEFTLTTSAAAHKTAKLGRTATSTATVTSTANASTEFPAILFLLGGPSAGKSTLARLISEGMQFAHISVEHLLAEAHADNTNKFHKIVLNSAASSVAVPTDIVVALIEAEMHALHTHGYLNFVVDGFPRSISHMKTWTPLMHNKTKPPCFVFIDVPDAELTQRCAANPQMDEQLYSIKMNVYKNETIPLCDELYAKKLLFVVDGTLPPAEVYAELENIINTV